MKIAMVFFDLSIPAGGQRQFLSLAQHLIKRGCEVKVYTCKIDRNIFPELWKNLEVVVVSSEGTGHHSWWEKLLFFNHDFYQYRDKAHRVVKKMDTDFDVINCHEDFAYRVGFFYKKINSNVRVVWSLNNVSYFFNPTGNVFQITKSYLLNIYKNIREKKYFDKVDVVAPLSRYEEVWCKDRKLNVKIVRSGLDFSSFYKPVKISGEHAPKVLVSMGALGPHRRFEVTIQVVAKLRNEGHDVRAVIIAKKLDKNENSYETIVRNLIHRLGVDEYVELRTEGVSEEELLQVYDSAHILVHPVFLPPPQYYGWGLVVFEAMAAGLPVVLCSTTGATEVLTDGKNALFAEPDDVESFALGVKRLITDPEYYGRIAQNGQNFVKDSISWDRYTESMMELFKE